MTNKEIIEGNKLIAEFMGLEKREATAVVYERYKWTDNHLYPVQVLQFDKSWDWLMPVVEKINDIECCVLDINSRDTFIRYIRPNLMYQVLLERTNAQSKIENSWQAIVDFIKWYNENNPIK